MGPYERLVPWINGFLFSMAHLPNPLLMTVTFVSGVLFTYVFLKERQIIPLALVHAIVGVLLSLNFGSIKAIMSVGPGYTTRLESPVKPPKEVDSLTIMRQ